MSLVAPFNLSGTEAFTKGVISTKVFSPFSSAFVIRDFLSEEEVGFLVKETTFKKQVGVGITGKVNETTEDDVIRSYRLTTKNEELANILYGRIAHLLSPIQNIHKNNSVWKPLGINPSFR